MLTFCTLVNTFSKLEKNFVQGRHKNLNFVEFLIKDGGGGGEISWCVFPMERIRGAYLREPLASVVKKDRDVIKQMEVHRAVLKLYSGLLQDFLFLVSNRQRQKRLKDSTIYW